MAYTESIQTKIQRVRPPRVKLTYKVFLNGAQEDKELPFVAAVVGNFRGDRLRDSRLKDDQFAEINRDNFDDVLKKVAPTVEIEVENLFDPTSNSMLRATFQATSLKSFSPYQVANQIPVLKDLLREADNLRELKRRLDGNDRFAEDLKAVAEDPNSLQSLAAQLGLEFAAADDAATLEEVAR